MLRRIANASHDRMLLGQISKRVNLPLRHLQLAVCRKGDNGAAAQQL